MSTTSENNKRIAKNTLMLYIRMAITMLVQLYTSRIVLDVLGIEDYGIWNLVATLVVSISFITGPLSSAIQRFLSYEIGMGNESKLNILFSQSIILYSLFSGIILILLETVGLWFLNTKLTIPNDKLIITNVIYQFSIASFIVTLLRMPYDAVIIAYEKMNFYAYISIIDVALKLGIVYLLIVVSSIPHLILYGILTLIVTVIITLTYKIFCNKNYACSKIKLKIDKSILKEIAAFSGWSLMGAFSVMTTNQGVSIVLNIFYGVAMNATMGIANQVGNAVNQFVSNFQLAFNPQIVKLYAQNNYVELRNIILRASRFSFLLLFAIAFPIIYNISEILYLWLGKNIPEYSSTFCSLIIVSLLFDAISAPLWMTVQATGKIREYQITISLLYLLNIVISFILLKIGYPPVSTMIVRCLVSIMTLIFRFLFVRNKIGLSYKQYCQKVILRILIVPSLSAVAFWIVIKFLPVDSLFRYSILNSLIFIIFYAFNSYFFGLTKQERLNVLCLFKKILHYNTINK